MGFWSDDLQPMLEVFQSETAELLGELSAQLLEAEKTGGFSADGVNRVFRAIHTIKSTAAVMGLEELSACTHQLEDVFQVFRAAPERLEGQLDAVLSLLYDYQDYVHDELRRTAEEDFAPASAGALPSRIEALLSALQKHEAIGVRVRLKKDCQMEGVRGEMLLRRIRPLCKTLRWEPETLDGPEAEYAIRKNGLRLYYTAAQPEVVQQKLARFRYTADVELLDADAAAQPSEATVAADSSPSAEVAATPAIQRTEVQEQEAVPLPPLSFAEEQQAADTPAQAAAPAAAQPRHADNREGAPSCTVSWQDVSTLQNLLGELITVDGTLTALAAQAPELPMLDTVARRYHSLLDHLEETAQRMSMTTLSAVCQQLYRTVRDICRQEGKQIRLQVTGEQTLADRTILDRITPALIHLVRNAADHGIEMPEERRACGKPEQGQITLDILADSGLLTLRLRDDGRGLKRETILRAAQRLGLLRKRPEEYTEQELHDLLLRPGFSTAAITTDISGRGVGLDVVRAAVDALGGALRIESIPGQFTAFSVQVPVSATSLDVLGFQIGRMVCLIPVRNVQRVDAVASAGDALYTVDGKLFYGRETPLPVLRLPEQAEEEDVCLVTLRSLNRSLVLLTGEALERMTVVERPLPPPFDAAYRSRTAVQGCCLLGDGRVGLTVSAERLIAMRRKEGTE